MSEIKRKWDKYKAEKWDKKQNKKVKKKNIKKKERYYRQSLTLWFSFMI